MDAYRNISRVIDFMDHGETSLQKYLDYSYRGQSKGIINTESQALSYNGPLWTRMRAHAMIDEWHDRSIVHVLGDEESRRLVSTLRVSCCGLDWAATQRFVTEDVPGRLSPVLDVTPVSPQDTKPIFMTYG